MVLVSKGWALDVTLQESPELDSSITVENLAEVISSIREEHKIQINVLDCQCVAYCVKITLSNFPKTQEEFVIRVRTKENQTFLLFCQKINGRLQLAQAPTHNVPMPNFVSAERDIESEIIPFLERTTFGYFDFEIATDEKIFASMSIAKKLKPITNGERRGRMSLFVAPGP